MKASDFCVSFVVFVFLFCFNLENERPKFIRRIDIEMKLVLVILCFLHLVYSGAIVFEDLSFKLLHFYKTFRIIWMCKKLLLANLVRTALNDQTYV